MIDRKFNIILILLGVNLMFLFVYLLIAYLLRNIIGFDRILLVFILFYLMENRHFHIGV